MKKILLGLSLAGAMLINGCATSVGQKIYDNRVIVYKVVVKGVNTFMTKEQIKKARLDKINVVVKGAHNATKGNDVDSLLEKNISK